jgi:hypothetical protein
MKAYWLFALGGVSGLAIAAPLLLPLLTTNTIANAAGPETDKMRAQHEQNSARTHTREKFNLTAHASMQEVAPLFGAHKERDWAPGWNPQFVHP